MQPINAALLWKRLTS